MTTAEADPIRTILVATDFSDPSRAAVAWATAIARQHGARVVVAHALSPQIEPSSVPEYVSVPADFPERVREACQGALDDIQAGLAEQGVTAETHLEMAHPAPALVEWAATRDADLLVCGTRGLTGFRHLVLGSTAEQLVRDAPCPVLTVHPNGARPPTTVRSVLVPTDFSEDAALAVTAAQGLLGAGARGRRILLLHAYHLPVEFTPLAGYIPVGPTLVADACDQARKRLEPIAELLRGRSYEVETLALDGYPPSVIEEVARQHEVDLVAMGTHGYSGLKHLLLGSTAERVVQHAPCPVLTVRRTRS